MGLMDKVKAQATQVAHKAQEAAQAGQAKLDQTQGRRRADSLLRDLGAAVYAERTGTADPDEPDEIERLVAEIAAFEAEHGPVSGATSDGGAADPAAGAPEGGFTLD